jgi:hypothetical protein
LLSATAVKGHSEDAAVNYVQHEHPIGRASQNYIIHAEVGEFDDGPAREQLWTVQLSPDTFEVACLPFFTYGVCFRDVVRIDTDHLLGRPGLHVRGHLPTEVAARRRRATGGREWQAGRMAYDEGLVARVRLALAGCDDVTEIEILGCLIFTH